MTVKVIKKEKKLYGSFLWIDFVCLQALQQLQRDSFLLTPFMYL